MKSLFCKSGYKTLAAQILQRTLLNYIAIKNILSFVSGSGLIGFSLVLSADFSVESGAKVSVIF